MSKKGSKRDGGALYKGMAIKLSDIVVGDTLGKPQERAVGRGETEGRERAREAEPQPRRHWYTPEAQHETERERHTHREKQRGREARGDGWRWPCPSPVALAARAAGSCCRRLVTVVDRSRSQCEANRRRCLPPPPSLSRRYRHLQPRADCPPQGERQIHGVEDPEEGAWHPLGCWASSQF